jgi:hypothetical protein
MLYDRLEADRELLGSILSEVGNYQGVSETKYERYRAKEEARRKAKATRAAATRERNRKRLLRTAGLV